MPSLWLSGLEEILKKLNSINVQINLERQEVFPEERYRLLSFYQYKRRFIDISSQGYFSFSKLTTSLIDFSFVRSLVASAYSKEGGACFDPASTIKIRDDATGLMQEYHMTASPVSLSLVSSKSELE